MWATNPLYSCETVLLGWSLEKDYIRGSSTTHPVISERSGEIPITKLESRGKGQEDD